MSYLYDKLKEALGGSKLTESKNSIINDWTPNGIRVIIISRNQIITVNHLGVFGGCTKKVDLDVDQVAMDLEEISRSNYGKPKLNGLLNKRSFSCLEELYVDAMFMNYPKVLDLVGYVTELVNSNSRLRYFGYGDFNDYGLRDYLNQAYKEAYSKKDYSYSLAKDKNRPCSIEYKDTGNKDWYKKYYLRPQFYKKDMQGGDLDIHFKKIEDGLKSLSKTEVAHTEVEKEAVKNRQYQVQDIVSRDAENIGYITKLKKLTNYIVASSDDICMLVKEPFKKILRENKKVQGFSPKVLESLNISDSSVKNTLNSFYSSLKIYGEGGEIPSRYSNGSDGFIPIGNILDEICVVITDELVKKGYKDLVGMALVTNLNIPDGKFSRKYLNKMERSKGEGSYQGYIDYIEDIVGVEV